MQNLTSKSEWLRLPKAGTRCAISGLSRTGLCELTVPSERNNLRPPVRSVLIKKRGAQRGVRLIDKASLLAFLDQLAATQLGNASTVNDSGETPKHE